MHRTTFRKACLSLALGLAALGTNAIAADAPQPYTVMHADPAGSYAIDPDHSSVSFEIGHAGVVPCLGVFKKTTGTFTFDPKHPDANKADVTVAVDSIDTLMPMRDEHIKGEGFLNAKRYPDMHFVSTGYKADGQDGGVLSGNLTLHGVTRPVQFKVHLEGAGKVSYLPKPWGGDLVGFIATTRIDRMDYGITAYPAAIGHNIDITVRLEAVRNPA